MSVMHPLFAGDRIGPMLGSMLSLDATTGFYNLALQSPGSEVESDSADRYRKPQNTRLLRNNNGIFINRIFTGNGASYWLILCSDYYPKTMLSSAE